jgi:hypothetical protein
VEKAHHAGQAPATRLLLLRLPLVLLGGMLVVLLFSRPAEAAERRRSGLLDPVGGTLAAATSPARRTAPPGPRPPGRRLPPPRPLPSAPRPTQRTALACRRRRSPPPAAAGSALPAGGAERPSSAPPATAAPGSPGPAGPPPGGQDASTGGTTAPTPGAPGTGQTGTSGVVPGPTAATTTRLAPLRPTLQAGPGGTLPFTGDALDLLALVAMALLAAGGLFLRAVRPGPAGAKGGDRQSR